MVNLQLSLYRLASRIVSPFLPTYLRRRAQAGKEFKTRLDERFGRSETSRPIGRLIWCHAASVGESMMMLPIIKHYARKPDHYVLLTTGTVTSAQIMEGELGDKTIHQFIPIDTPKAVARFLNHWHPDAAIFAESEIWPNLISQTAQRNIPLALVNARLGEQSRKRWLGRSQSLGKTLFGKFDLILPADLPTQSALSKLTGSDLDLTGNLKYAADPLSVDIKQLAAYRAVIGKRPVWCAASTHKGEDEIIIKAHKNVMKTHPEALLILVPRHPERGMALEKDIETSGLDYTVSAYAEDISPLTNIILVPRIGALGLAFRLSNIVFMGGSLLTELRGHNPLEASRLDCAILSGPHVSSFEEIYKGLHQAGGLIWTADETSISKAIRNHLNDPDIRGDYAKKALDFARSQDQILDHVISKLDKLIYNGQG